MLWNNLICLDYFSFKSWKAFGWIPDNWTFKFMKILAQTMNNFSKVRQNENNLIYVEMVKVLQETPLSFSFFCFVFFILFYCCLFFHLLELLCIVHLFFPLILVGCLNCKTSSLLSFFFKLIMMIVVSSP